MQVVDDASAYMIENFLDRLGSGARTKEGQNFLQAIRTHKKRSYGRTAKDRDMSHYKVVLRDPKVAEKLLPSVHRAISNARTVIRFSYRGISKKHLQSYLSEIRYRFDRRFWEKEGFDRLVEACISTQTITHGDLLQQRGNQITEKYSKLSA